MAELSLSEFTFINESTWTFHMYFRHLLLYVRTSDNHSLNFCNFLTLKWQAAKPIFIFCLITPLNIYSTAILRIFAAFLNLNFLTYCWKVIVRRKKRETCDWCNLLILNCTRALTNKPLIRFYILYNLKYRAKLAIFTYLP